MKLNVAVLDDQEASLAGFTQILRRVAAVEPVCFKKASDGLHWLAAMTPVFIVVNQTLADINGLDFIRRMRLVPGREATPVIFTTSSKSDRDLRRAAFDLDIFAYLEKPINPSEFLVHAMHIVDITREREELKRRLEQAGNLHTTTSAPTGDADAVSLEIDAMQDVAALHDPSLVTHLNLAAQLAVAIAREAKLTPDEIGTLGQAARIYDIGKVAIPQRILESRVPVGQADRVTIEAHAHAGAKVLAVRQSPVMRAATLLAQTHHEKYDGTGYPRKMRGSQIPIAGRIVAVADSFAALIQMRPHRPAHTLSKALEIVEAQSGGAFDPAIVQALRAALPEISRFVHEQFGRAAS